MEQLKHLQKWTPRWHPIGFCPKSEIQSQKTIFFWWRQEVLYWEIREGVQRTCSLCSTNRLKLSVTIFCWCFLLLLNHQLVQISKHSMAIYLYSQIPNWQSVWSPVHWLSSSKLPHWSYIINLISIHSIHISWFQWCWEGKLQNNIPGEQVKLSVCFNIEVCTSIRIYQLHDVWEWTTYSLCEWPYNNLCGFRLSYPLSPNDWPHLWYMESGHSICQICTSFIISWCQTLS